MGQSLGHSVPVYNPGGRDHALFAVYTNAVVEIYFYWYQRKPPFESEDKRMEILHRLNKIEGISLPEDAIKRRPSIKLSLLANQNAWNNSLLYLNG